MALERIEDNFLYLRNPANLEPIKDPFNGEYVNSIQNACDLENKISSLKTGLCFWKNFDKQEFFLRLHNKIYGNRDNLANLITQESGRPLVESYIEIAVALDALKYAASGGVVKAGYKEECRGYNLLNKLKSMVVENVFEYDKVGDGKLIAMIAPSNSALMIPIVTLAEVLSSNNVFLLKPSEHLPLTAKKIGDFCYDGWREMGFKSSSVVEVAVGDQRVGEGIVNYTKNSSIDKLIFVGSRGVGLKIKQELGDKVRLELGGNDAFIVLDDVCEKGLTDMGKVAMAAVAGAYFNAGQQCCSVKRIFVTEKNYELFFQKFRKYASRLVVGDGFDSNVDVGTLLSKAQHDKLKNRLEKLTEDEVRGYTEFSLLPKLHNLYFKPTLVYDVKHDASILKEEFFGPITLLIEAKDVNEVVRLVNDSPFGLSASVWTRDIKKGIDVVRRLEVSNKYVNDIHISFTDPQLPWGGAKDSGHYVGSGFSNDVTKVLIVNSGVDFGAPWMWKNSGEKLELFKRAIEFMHGPLCDKVSCVKMLYNFCKAER